MTTATLNRRTTRQLREAISALSTHNVSTYYNRVSDWHRRLEEVLETYGLTTRWPCLSIHTDTGRGYVEIVADPEIDSTYLPPVSGVSFAWYRMLSGNWEVICYPS